ncbi:hypothetical protein B9C99_08565 [Rhodococcus sp. BUPNP1]|nr:hypothetical protein B9C99_08565 [Rhodococcus sp. BUPNP1]
MTHSDSLWSLPPATSFESSVWVTRDTSERLLAEWTSCRNDPGRRGPELPPFGTAEKPRCDNLPDGAGQKRRAVIVERGTGAQNR